MTSRRSLAENVKTDLQTRDLRRQKRFVRMETIHLKSGCRFSTKWKHEIIQESGF